LSAGSGSYAGGTEIKDKNFLVAAGDVREGNDVKRVINHSCYMQYI
jgi:hypothetical protein